MAIYDCFPYFNEADLLEIRLEELKDSVDYFVLGEANTTFSGNPKPFYFLEQQERFAKYPIKRVEIVFDGSEGDSWARETSTFRQLAAGITGADPADIICLSMLDEIPSGNQVKEYSSKIYNREIDSAVWLQDLYYYYANCWLEPNWPGTRMIRKDRFTDMINLRLVNEVAVHGGWHFSYIGGLEQIKKKMAAYSHTELNTANYTNEEHLKHCLGTGADLFGRITHPEFRVIDDRLPRYLVENKERFAHLFHEA